MRKDAREPFEIVKRLMIHTAIRYRSQANRGSNDQDTRDDAYLTAV